MNNKILICLIVALYHTITFGQKRDFLAVPGAERASQDWIQFTTTMANPLNRYDIRDIFSPSGYNRIADVNINVTNLKNMVNNPTKNYDDVLAAGHDVGGLALRGATLVTPKIKANILVGTPNRGSRLIREIKTANNSNPSPLEIELDLIKSWTGTSKCNDCDIAKQMKDYIIDLKNNAFLSCAQTDPNGYYNNLPLPDNNTTAIIWGDAGNQGFPEYLSSTGISGTINLRECKDRLEALRKSNLKNQKLQAVISGISSFFEAGIKIATALVSPTKGIAGAIATAFNSLSNATLELIKNVKDIKNEQRDILICALASKKAEAAWILAVSGRTANIVLVNSPNYSQPLCQENYYQCQYNTGHPNHASFCYLAGLYCPTQVPTLVAEPTDLLYTKTEQTLPSISRTYRIQANHMQEQDWAFNSVPMNTLFSGAEGAVFKVYKY